MPQSSTSRLAWLAAVIELSIVALLAGFLASKIPADQEPRPEASSTEAGSEEN